MSEPSDVKTKAPAKSRPARKPSAAELAWQKNTLEPTLAKNPERQKEFTTVSSYPIERLYTEADLAEWDPSRDLGFPGEPPYTRGIHATMHRGRLWNCGGHESTLPLPPGSRPDRALHRFRFANFDGLRLRSSAL
jgi:hypothetical protein